MGFRFRDFELYKDLRQFVKDIYALSEMLPKKESFGLVLQLRRAAVSIVLNLAEGAMKKSDAEFNRFTLISIGSVSEVAAILDICFDLKYLTTSTHKAYMLKCETIAKRLFGFSRKLRT